MEHRSSETPYANREIDEKYEDIQASLARIENQTVRTNGRVSELEKWKAYVLGFCGAISLLILPILFKLFFVK